MGVKFTLIESIICLVVDYIYLGMKVTEITSEDGAFFFFPQPSYEVSDAFPI